MRVESLAGEVRQVELGNEPTVGGASFTWEDGRPVRSNSTRPEVFPPLDPRAPQPTWDGGLVVARPHGMWRHFGDPMFVNYHWVAMLDPAEFADGEDGPPLVIDSLAEVDHHGRPAWEAVVRPTAEYAPRCGCCPLLFSRESEDIEAGGGAVVLRDREPDLRYADRHRVRLDAATGVCVETEEIGGSRAGQGHTLRLEAVDEPMADELFQRR